jgi:hypothetical protein
MRVLTTYAIVVNGVVKVQPIDHRVSELIVMNNSSGVIYLGANESVSESNGFPIFPNDIMSFRCNYGSYFYLYGSGQEVRILEVY